MHTGNEFKQAAVAFLQPISELVDDAFPLTYRLRDQPVFVRLIGVDDTVSQDLPRNQVGSGIAYIHVWEDQWARDEAIVRSRIMALVKARERIHARQTQVVRLDKATAAAFLDANHLQKSTSAYYKYGLEKNGELVAVASFSKSRVMHDGPVYYRSYEMERFATRQGSSVVGGLGKLLNHFIAQHHPAHLMTYADLDWGTGERYAKLGFVFDGYTSPQEFLVNPVTMERLYAQRVSAGIDTSGFVRIHNSGNARWVKWVQKL